jgi:hypothetical protein
MSFHHAYIGGLLEHTLNAMEVAHAIAPFYPALNRDLVIAGIFLHDIAKVWELCYDCAFGYTDGGHLVGHIVKSAIWIEQKARVAEQVLGEKLPQALIDVLQHIIVSHHGTPEFGAIKCPATPEAIAVHFIENLDAKLMMSLAATRGDGSTGEGNWTEYMRAFNGRLYKPDVAPAEAEETEPAAAPPLQQPPPPPPPLNRHVPGPGSSSPPELPRQSNPVPTAVRGASNGDAQPAHHASASNGPVRLAINNPLFETAPQRNKK